MLPIPLVGDGVLGERLIGDLERQVLLIQPEYRCLTGQSSLAVDPRVAEPRIALRVDAPQRANGKDPARLVSLDMPASGPPEQATAVVMLREMGMTRWLPEAEAAVSARS
jgi:hypothetical protein